MSNFEILNQQYPELARLGSLAESYVYLDPSSAVLKLRIFSEKLVNLIYRYQQFHQEERWTYFDRLENPEFKDNVDRNIVKKLHAIRVKGNNAAHKDSLTSNDALWLLEESYYVACWFKKLYMGTGAMECGEFIRPIDEGTRINQLQETIKELEEAMAQERELNRLAIVNQVEADVRQTYQFREANIHIAEQMNLNDTEIVKRIGLDEIYAEYELTHEQEELVQELKQFLSDRGKHLFLLKGYAGTGKTFIVKGLTDYFDLTDRTYRLAAPTGKAARVISEKTKKNAYTIHKTIYSNKDIKEYKTADTDGSETYKFYYDLNINEDPATMVYIIDEASMISDIYSEGEFFRFGTGHLLKDLLNFINLDNNDHDKKIIFIGDSAQLPPIGMNFSPALDAKYLHDTHLLQSSEYELTEVVRQAQDSGVLQNAIAIRTALENKVFNRLDIDTNFDDIIHIEHQDLMNRYLESCGNEINAESIVIAYSNASVSEYNRRVREHFFPNQPMMAPGDKVMSLINIAFDDLMISNGDFGLVKEVAPHAEPRGVTIRRKAEDSDEVIEIRINLVFREVVLGFNDAEGKARFFRCKIIENLLYSHKPQLTSDEQKALYVDFRIRRPELKPGTKEFKDALRMDPYFNPMRVKFGYAITCHKAQGSEWNHVFVNCQHNNTALSAEYFRWLYTAITRTSKKLYLLDEPHIRPTSGMTRIGSVFDENFNDIIKESDVILDDISNLFGISPSNSFLITLLKSVSENVKRENITIVDIQHNQYQEAYLFTDGHERCRINIHYNGKHEISNISSQNQDELSNKIILLLASLKHKKIISKPADTVADTKNFNFSEPFLEEFYESLKKVLEPQDIKIVEISSYPWLEKYLFTKYNDMAAFDFYYNGKKQFTRFAEQPNKSTSVEFIRELNQILSNEIK
jgi:Cdc6-like AAA superfamily ATPase